MYLAGFVSGVVSLLVLQVLLLCIHPWLRAFTSGGRVSLSSILGMRLRGNPATLIIDAYVSLLHAGKTVTLSQVESLYITERSYVRHSGDLVRLVKEQLDD